MCMANTILKQVNDVGAILGYPFYVYPDGTCGKSIVSGKMNAIGIVKKKFPVQELKSEFLENIREDDEDVLKHLSQIGENIGFPFYVYADGTCGSTPVSVTNKFPFTMFVKQKFLVEQLVLDVELLQKIQAKKAQKTSNQSGLTALSTETLSDDEFIAYCKAHLLSEADEMLMLETRCDEMKSLKRMLKNISLVMMHNS